MLVPTHRSGEAIHHAKCAALAAQVKAAGLSGGSIRLRKPTSNLFRQRQKSATTFVDVRQLNQVLSVDPERRVAHVEGMATYESIVRETLKHGLVPAVVPQLKTITAGGAVSGLGIESSSFRFGLV